MLVTSLWCQGLVRVYSTANALCFCSIYFLIYPSYLSLGFFIHRGIVLCCTLYDMFYSIRPFLSLHFVGECDTSLVIFLFHLVWHGIFLHMDMIPHWVICVSVHKAILLFLFIYLQLMSDILALWWILMHKNRFFGLIVHLSNFCLKLSKNYVSVGMHVVLFTSQMTCQFNSRSPWTFIKACTVLCCINCPCMFVRLAR